MRELVGVCQECKKEIYCENGFLNGIVEANGELKCFGCDEKKEK